MENIGHLTAYRSIWLEDYEAEKRKLQDVFGTAALEIEHIGSTSIEGMPSNPIIDIAIMIQSRKDADTFTELLAQIGYEFEPATHSNIPERHYYIKGDPDKYHLSIDYTDSGGFWVRQILFRDYLRSSQDAREEYASLKERLIGKYPSGKGQYSEGKTEFVYRILRLAGWRVGQGYGGPHSPAAERPPSVRGVVPREDYSLAITFSSSEEGTLDLSSWVQTGAFHQVETYEDFRTVHVAHGTVRWDCGIVLDPAYVYSRSKKT